MVRVLVGGPTSGNADATPGAPDSSVDAAARRLRDAGHEVVLATPGVSAAQLAAAAIQEDVLAIGVVSAAGDDAVGALPDALAAYDAGDIVVFALDEALG